VAAYTEFALGYLTPEAVAADGQQAPEART